MLKKKNVYVVGEYDVNVIYKIIENSYTKTKMYKLENNKDLYQWQNNQWILCEFNFSIIDFNSELAKMIIKLIFETHEEIQNVKTSNIFEDKQKYGTKRQFEGKIDGIINSLVNTYAYFETNQKKDVIDFVATFLYRTLHAHEFNNGNKRTSLVSAAKLLKIFGFYIVWSSDKSKLAMEWENFMIQISAAREKQEKEQETIEKIRNKILSACWLSL